MEAYCLNCRDKMKMKNAEATTMKNGWVAIHGICPVCSTIMFRIRIVKNDFVKVPAGGVTGKEPELSTVGN